MSLVYDANGVLRLRSVGELAGLLDAGGLSEGSAVYSAAGIRKVVGPLLWTPANTTCIAWYSSDFGVGRSGANAVNWIDRVGTLGIDLVNAVGTPPTYVASVQNGLPIVRFDGTNDMLRSAVGTYNLYQNKGTGWMYSVRKFAASPTAERNICVVTSTVANVSRLHLCGGATSGKSTTGGRRLDADAFQHLIGAANIDTTKFEIHGAFVDWTNSDAFLYINGVLDGSTLTFQTSGSTSNTAAAVITMGSYSSSAGTAQSEFMNGDIAEVILGETTLTTALRQQIEGYLAYKWGLQANLEITHPYRFIPPLV